MDLLVDGAGRQQLLVGASADDPSLLQNQDQVAILNGADPLGDRDQGTQDHDYLSDGGVRCVVVRKSGLGPDFLVFRARLVRLSVSR